MSELNTPVETTDAPKAAVKKTVKKAAPTKAVKKAVKKASPAKTKATPPKIGERRTELRNPQIAILSVVAKAKGGSISRKDIAEACPGVGLSEHLGTLSNTQNKYTISLVEHKYVKQEQHEIDGKDTIVYSITASGRKALEKANS